MAKCALTTFDNPFDPFDEFDSWYRFDCDKKYFSSQYLARIARTSSQLTDEENDAEIERAIDEIIKLDPFNMYKKVTMTEENASDNANQSTNSPDLK